MKTNQLKSFCFLALATISLAGYAQPNTFPANGNVGIGTITPGNKLSVNGKSVFGGSIGTSGEPIEVQGPVSGVAHKDRNGVSTRWVNYVSGGLMRFYNDANGDRVVITTAGNVGIGTITPTSRLTVFGGGGGSIDFKVNGRLQTGDASNAGGMWCNAALTQFVGQLDATKLGVWNNGWRLMVENNGNVGIGTTTASNRLTVFGGGGGNIDFKVNGRLQTGDASNAGGMWCNAAGTQFVGQIDAAQVGFWNNGGWRLAVANDGKVTIGNVTTPGAYKLYVETGILTEKVKVALKSSAQWADHVFSSSYQLKSLTDVEAFIKTNKHLEGIPSADQLVKEGGIDMNVMFAKHMEKIEELTLYLIDIKKEIEILKTENSELKSRNTNK